MKIGLVITRLVRGGAAKMVLATARELRARGQDVFVAAGTHPGDENSYWPELDDSPIPSHPLRHLVRPPGWRDPLALVELAAFLRRHRPDCLHLHTSKAGTLGALAARLTGTGPVVYSSHGHLFHAGASIQGLNLSGWRRPVYRWLRRITLGLADRTVALSPADLRDQIEHGLTRGEDFVVIPNGIDPDDFPASRDADTLNACRRKLGLESFDSVIMHVGRHVPEKGLEDLLRAADILLEHHPNTGFVLVGNGPRTEALRSRVRTMGRDEQVVFTGPRDDVERLLYLADVFCFPSRYESQGLALMEAMMAKRPCVATDQGGLSELVVHEETALRVSPRSPGELAGALHRLLENPQLRGRLGERARNFVEEHFTLQQSLDRTLALYRRLVDGTG